MPVEKMRADESGVDISKVDRLVRRWDLVADGDPLSTHSGWVGFYRLDDRPVVLKVPSPESDEGGSHRILRHYGGAGAVRPLKVAEDALLLERACPGDALSGLVIAGRDDEATQIVCETMKALAKPPIPTGLPTVEDWG
ncbi:MAG: aminoglycoside phosphotransferase family protein [Pseudomonadota bacterium]